MSNQLIVIENTLTKKETSTSLAIALGLSPSDENAMNRAAKYAYGVITTIKASIGTKNDLSGCDPDSIKDTMIEAANRGVYIDGRQHAHLVSYGKKCTFQMGWRGYLAKIKEFYPDADFTVEAVYKGDEVKIWNDNGVQKYTHTKAGAFRSGAQDFLGVLFAVTYTDNGRLIQKVLDVPKERIDRARKAAKQDFIWSSDYIEKAKAAAIKNACKVIFASLQGLQDVIDYDNRNYDPNMPATPARKSIVDNIVASIEDQTPPDDTEDFIDVLPEPELVIDTEHQSALIEAGKSASDLGFGAYKEWVLSLSESNKDLVRHMHEDWMINARKISMQAQAQAPQDESESPPI